MFFALRYGMYTLIPETAPDGCVRIAIPVSAVAISVIDSGVRMISTEPRVFRVNGKRSANENAVWCTLFILTTWFCTVRPLSS
jgi:hypothetical protein